MSDAENANRDPRSQVKANPTHITLDALEHEADLEQQRQKRKDSAIPIEAPAYVPKKTDLAADGEKKSQSVDDEYSMKEGRKK